MNFNFHKQGVGRNYAVRLVRKSHPAAYCTGSDATDQPEGIWFQLELAKEFERSLTVCKWEGKLCGCNQCEGETVVKFNALNNYACFLVADICSYSQLLSQSVILNSLLRPWCVWFTQNRTALVLSLFYLGTSNTLSLSNILNIIQGHNYFTRTFCDR